jgi:hypothetical protein
MNPVNQRRSRVGRFISQQQDPNSSIVPLQSTSLTSSPRLRRLRQAPFPLVTPNQPAGPATRFEGGSPEPTHVSVITLLAAAGFGFRDYVDLWRNGPVAPALLPVASGAAAASGQPLAESTRTFRCSRNMPNLPRGPGDAFAAPPASGAMGLGGQSYDFGRHESELFVSLSSSSEIARSRRYRTPARGWHTMRSHHRERRRLPSESSSFRQPQPGYA